MQNLKLYFSAIILAPFSKKFYYELFVEHKFFGFIYILFLSFLISIPISSKVKSELNNFIGISQSSSLQEINDNIEFVANQIPELKISDNKITSNLQSPVIGVSKANKPIFIIDDKDSLKDFQLYDNVIIFKPEKILLIFDKTLIPINYGNILSDISQYLNKENGEIIFDLKRLFMDISGIFYISEFVFLIFTSFWFFIRYSIKALAFSLFAFILINILLPNRTFSFRAYFRVSAFTLTPIFILEFISFYLNIIIFSNPGLVYFVAHLLYIYYAVDSYKKMSFKNIV